MDPYDIDIVVERLRKLRIDVRRSKGRNKNYDELYLPKAEKVKYYVNSSPNRAFWLKHPKEPLPSQWYIELIPGTKQFKKVVDPLKKFIGKKCQIVEVDKVCNKYLERQYLLKKEEKEYFAPCKEHIMYHFTVEDYLDSIILNNFNWRLSGTSRGHKYGYGISFSPDPSFAEQFCKNKGMKVVIVAKILITDCIIGEPDSVLPSGDCDTTRSPKKTVYVKFDDSEFYPEYIVYYSRK